MPDAKAFYDLVRKGKNSFLDAYRLANLTGCRRPGRKRPGSRP